MTAHMGYGPRMTPERENRLRADIRRAFSITIRDLRSKKGIAQEALALEALVARGYMGTLERGESTPTLETIFKLLPQLDIDFVQFAELLQANLKRAKRKAIDAIEGNHMANKRSTGLEPRYTAIYTLHEAGQKAMEHTVTAGFEVAAKDGIVALDVAFDETGDQFRSLEVELDAKAARELAYSLLLAANDL